MGGFGEGIEALIKFCTWFVPIAGALAAWKLFDIAIWLFHHIHIS